MGGYTRCVTTLLDADATPALEMLDEAGLTPLKAAALSHNSLNEHLARLLQDKRSEAMRNRSALWERVILGAQGESTLSAGEDDGSCFSGNSSPTTSPNPFVRTRSQSFA